MRLRPVAMYADMLSAISASPKLVVAMLDAGPPTERDALAEALLHAINSRGTLMHTLNELIVAEVRSVGANANPNPNLLFRSNSAVTKLLEVMCRLCSGNFRQATLRPCVSVVYEARGAHEVDPARSADPPAMKRAWVSLVAYMSGLWGDILASVDACPPPLRQLLGCLRRATEAQFGAKHDSCAKVVGAIFFLRFLGPALQHPHLHGVMLEAPSEGAMRTLTLLTKTLIMLANHANFGNKEAYMTHMNSAFLDSRLQQAHDLLLQLSNSPPLCRDRAEQLPLALPRNELPGKLASLYTFLRRKPTELLRKASHMGIQDDARNLLRAMHAINPLAIDPLLEDSSRPAAQGDAGSTQSPLGSASRSPREFWTRARAATVSSVRSAHVNSQTRADEVTRRGSEKISPDAVGTLTSALLAAADDPSLGVPFAQAHTGAQQPSRATAERASRDAIVGQGDEALSRGCPGEGRLAREGWGVHADGGHGNEVRVGADGDVYCAEVSYTAAHGSCAHQSDERRSGTAARRSSVDGGLADGDSVRSDEVIGGDGASAASGPIEADVQRESETGDGGSDATVDLGGAATADEPGRDFEAADASEEETERRSAETDPQLHRKALSRLVEPPALLVMSSTASMESADSNAPECATPKASLLSAAPHTLEQRRNSLEGSAEGIFDSLRGRGDDFSRYKRTCDSPGRWVTHGCLSESNLNATLAADIDAAKQEVAGGQASASPRVDAADSSASGTSCAAAHTCGGNDGSGSSGDTPVYTQVVTVHNLTQTIVGSFESRRAIFSQQSAKAPSAQTRKKSRSENDRSPHCSAGLGRSSLISSFVPSPLSNRGADAVEPASATEALPTPPDLPRALSEPPPSANSTTRTRLMSSAL